MSTALKEKIHEIIFGTETPAGKLFDVVLIYTILLSVFALMLDSVSSISARFGDLLTLVEWLFTILFTLEYIARIYSSPDRWRYVRSFYGICDLASILPTYLSIFLPGANYLLIVRLLRVLRVFRVFKLARYISETNTLIRAMLLSRRKIQIFFMVVLVLSIVFGSLMYLLEGPDNGFSNIPRSVYWTIVTITTVGYGDIIPHTVLGQIVASLAMLTGYSIIAVPTGILTAELAQEMARERNMITCEACTKAGHDRDAEYCKFCGEKLIYKKKPSTRKKSSNDPKN